MAKNTSLFKVEGTLDNVTFYKSADGHFVRTKGGVSKSRILNDPAFIRTRENGAEFGRSAGAGKMLRMASGTSSNPVMARIIASARGLAILAIVQS